MYIYIPRRRFALAQKQSAATRSNTVESLSHASRADNPSKIIQVGKRKEEEKKKKKKRKEREKKEEGRSVINDCNDVEREIAF